MTATQSTVAATSAATAATTGSTARHTSGDDPPPGDSGSHRGGGRAHHGDSGAEHGDGGAEHGDGPVPPPGRPVRPFPRFDDATLTTDSAVGTLGPLVVTADDEGLLLTHRGTAEVRRLPWASTVAVAAADGPDGAVLIVHTDRAVHRLYLPRVDRAAVIAALAPVLPAPGGAPPPAARVVPEAPRPTRPAPPASHPAIPRTERRRRAPSWLDAAASPTFQRLRPVLTVALVLAVATMVALLLAASAGAVHLSWLQ